MVRAQVQEFEAHARPSTEYASTVLLHIRETD
jgi:hypothetical protein